MLGEKRPSADPNFDRDGRSVGVIRGTADDSQCYVIDLAQVAKTDLELRSLGSRTWRIFHVGDEDSRQRVLELMRSGKPYSGPGAGVRILQVANEGAIDVTSI